MKIKLTDKKIILLILFLVVAVLIIPWVLRWSGGNTTLIGDYAYHHLQLSENPSLLFQAKFFTPYGLILFVLNSIVKSEVWSIILPILLGIGTILLFNNFLRKFNLTQEQKFFILVFLILSPAFIYFFAFSNHYGLIIFLLLLMANLFHTKNLKYLAWPLIVILPWFDLLTTLVVLSILLVYWSLKKDKTALYLMIGLFLLAALIQILYPQPWIYEPLRNINFLAEFFSDLGGLKGISFFYLILASIGLIVTWKKRRIYYFAYPAIFLLILLVNLNPNLNIYLNFILAFFSGLGLMWLWQRKWKLNFLKNLSILVLLIGVVFSTGSYLNQISRVPPNIFIKESLEWLKDNSRPGEIVIAHQDKGFWIGAIAERPAFLDVYDENYSSKLNIAENIFYSREIDLTTQLLEENEVKYIWIDMEMLEGQVWSEEDEGLLFLFRNPRFTNIYAKRGIEIWRFN